MEYFRMKSGMIKLGYREAKTHGMNYKTFYALMIVLVCLNTTQARKGPHKRYQACIHTVRHLKEQIALECPPASIKCKLLNGCGQGCAPVCDKIRQCKEFDESLGPFVPGTGSSFPEATEVCEVLAAGCMQIQAGPLFCYIEPGTTDRPCCSCGGTIDIGILEGLLVSRGICKQNA